MRNVAYLPLKHIKFPEKFQTLVKLYILRTLAFISGKNKFN